MQPNTHFCLALLWVTRYHLGMNEYTNRELFTLCEPWGSIWCYVITRAIERVRASVSLIGVPKATGRAGRMADCIKMGMAALCDQVDPLLQLVDGPENDIDYCILDTGPSPFAVRWGRLYVSRTGDVVNRNSTERQGHIQSSGYIEEQGVFSFAENDLPTPSRLPTVTVTYSVEDDFTASGIPQWWIGRVVVLRERLGYSEHLGEIGRYSKREIPSDPNWARSSPEVIDRRDDEEEMNRLIERLRRNIG